MREEDVTAAQIGAYWNALVRHQDVRDLPLDPELAATIQRLHTLNIPVPDAARDRVRDVVQRSLERHHAGASPMTTPTTLSVPGALTVSLPTPRWPSPTRPIAVERSQVVALAAMLVLILVLGAASLPFLAIRLSQGPEHLAILPALIHPDQFAPAVGVMTGGDDPLVGPSGVAVGADGTLYVIDVPRDQVRVFAPDGTPKATWGTSGDGPGEFGFSFDFAWGDLAVAPDGNLYVLDPNLARIQVFDPDGTYLFGFGERGSEEGQILYPMGIGVGPNGNVYVADWQNHRVQVFAGDGTFLAAWDGTKDGGQPLAGPQDVAVDSDGTAWVTDEILQRVIGFAPDGSIVGSFGKGGSKPGEVWGLRGIAIDAKDTIYVAEFENDRVQAFTRDGDVVGILGTSGEKPGQLTEPGYLAIGPDGTIYVTEERPKRLQAFAPDALIPADLRSTPVPSS